jgi:DNA transformation protein
MESAQDMLPWAQLAYEAALRKANAPPKRGRASRRPR